MNTSILAVNTSILAADPSPHGIKASIPGGNGLPLAVNHSPRRVKLTQRQRHATPLRCKQAPQYVNMTMSQCKLAARRINLPPQFLHNLPQGTHTFWMDLNVSPLYGWTCLLISQLKQYDSKHGYKKMSTSVKRNLIFWCFLVIEAVKKNAWYCWILILLRTVIFQCRDSVFISLKGRCGFPVYSLCCFGCSLRNAV